MDHILQIQKRLKSIYLIDFGKARAYNYLNEEGVMEHLPLEQ